ncbi:vacuolar membrane-associated protein iml1, partial [Vermiconidia calcicola]
MGNSIGVDIVSLSPKPLHPVPLFQYIKSGGMEYALPHWADISYWKSEHDRSGSTWPLADATDGLKDVTMTPVHIDGIAGTGFSTSQVMDAFDERMFSNTGLPAQETMRESHDANHPLDPSGTMEAQNESRPNSSRSASMPARESLGDAGQATSPSLLTGTARIRKPKKTAPPPHPLMQMGRKISVGPKGLALSQGVASTTVSGQHAQYGKETTVSLDAAGNNRSTGLAKQIRESLRGQPSQAALASQSQQDLAQASKPIDIHKSEAERIEDLPDPASIVEKAMMKQSGSSGANSGGSLSATPKADNMSARMPEAIALEGADAGKSPWLTLLNPCNPRRDNMQVASEFRQWQNAFPKAISSSLFKWDSLCAPAVLPLMTENRISFNELERHYKKQVRRLFAAETEAHSAMVRMISLRLAAGFQIVPMRRLRNAQMPSEQINRMLLSLGDQYQELRCLSDVEVQVNEYQRDDALSGPGSERVSDYAVRLRPVAGRKEKPTKIELATGDSSTDWSYLDDQCMNLTALADGQGSFRMRFVLIPVHFPQTESQSHTQARGLSDEERRIDGIQRLTQMWQRNRYFFDEDQRHLSSMIKPKASGTIDRDPNPLAIEYQTRDPSAVVSAYGPSMTGQLAPGDATEPLFAESERYHSSNFDMVKLVKQLQEPPPVGVEVKDRRWFTRLHLKCFRGDEMTNWLLRAFKDLETRQDAVAVGNQMMEREIFSHVRGKHEFRDGNYFYQIKSEYRTTAYPDTAGFFARGIGRSVPSTPMSE